MAKEYKLKDITSLSLAAGDKKEAEVEGIDGAKVLLVNTGGKVQATGAKCTHYGAPMAKGVLTKGGRLVCPWHGACFNAQTGDVEDAPALDALPIFQITERDGAVYVTGDESVIKSSRRSPNFKCSADDAGVQDRIVVIGGGSGAMGVVEGLRENGSTTPITVISNEGYLPIDRPKLSKALITNPEKLAWRDESWFKSGRVDFTHGEAKSVDFANRTVSTADGNNISYSKLVLATGGTPKQLPLQGFRVLGNIFTLRSIHDTRKIVDAIGDKGKNIVIIGSSFIGMEIANATNADNNVSVVGMEKVPLERVLGEQVGGGLQNFLEGKGIKFHMGASVDKAEPAEADPSKVGAVYLKDGTKLPADIVILGVGVSPATEYIKDNSIVRLEQDGSLKTDDSFAVQGVKDAYAIGDIATFPYNGPGGNGKLTRIEHWNVAQNSGRAVAAHIVNPSVVPKQFIPVFWSALGGQMRYCGNTIGGWDDVVLQGSPAEGKFAAFYANGDTVVAVATMGRDPIVMQSAELMREGNMPSKADIKGGVDVLSVEAQ